MKSNHIMWIKHGPYLLLAAANIIYLFVHGLKPIQYHPKLILYNFLFFLLVGVVVFFKLSHHLYQWFVKDEGDMRQKAKAKLEQLTRMAQIGLGYFRPGNLHNLVYLYAILASWTVLSYIVPPLLLGVTYGLIFQARTYAYQNYPEYVNVFYQRIHVLIAKVEDSLPRYEQRYRQE